MSIQKHFLIYQLLFPFLFLCGCRDSRPKQITVSPRCETIYRCRHDEAPPIPDAHPLPAPLYPWKIDERLPHPRITKEFFRCRGDSLHPPHWEESDGKKFYYFDCRGRDQHSLPLRDGKEFIFPALLEILNFIQQKSGRRVIITSGHRCLEHNRYVDPSPSAQGSKHQIGAAVAFYLEGEEAAHPLVLSLIQEYYATHPLWKNEKNMTDFVRYEKQDLDIATPPWMNREIFVKWYQEKEGRNLENSHPYPYWQIQVRWDRDRRERVLYDWKLANALYKF